MSLKEVQAELLTLILLAVLHEPGSLCLGLVYHGAAAGWALAAWYNLVGKGSGPVSSAKRRSRPIEVSTIKHSHLFLKLFSDILSRSVQCHGDLNHLRLR